MGRSIISTIIPCIARLQKEFAFSVKFPEDTEELWHTQTRALDARDLDATELSFRNLLNK
jgi:hypothetical protein